MKATLGFRGNLNPLFKTRFSALLTSIAAGCTPSEVTHEGQVTLPHGRTWHEVLQQEEGFVVMEMHGKGQIPLEEMHSATQGIIWSINPFNLMASLV